MVTILRYTLRRFRGQILGWGISLALLGLLIGSMYDVVATQREQFQDIIQLYPQELIAFFGDLDSFATPEGFLAIEFFSYMPLVLGVFGVLAGSGLLVEDEENGTLDLILAHPVSRTALFAGRLLALLTATLAILTIIWMGLTLPIYWSTMDLKGEMIWLPLLSLMAEMSVFSTLALLLSMLLPSRRAAAMTAGLLLVLGFFLPGLAGINEDLQPIARFSPLDYYQTGDAFHDFNLSWFAGLLISALALAALSWWLFQRRDIRVRGEGGWRLP